MTDPLYGRPDQPTAYDPYGQQYLQPGHPGYERPGYAQVPPYGYPPAYPAAPYGLDPATGQPLSDKSRVAAGLLQLFFGCFGVGRFYLGHTGIGAAQLGLWLIGMLLSIVVIGIPILMGVWLWTLIDAIMMFTGGVKDSQGRLLRT